MISLRHITSFLLAFLHMSDRVAYSTKEKHTPCYTAESLGGNGNNGNMMYHLSNLRNVHNCHDVFVCF